MEGCDKETGCMEAAAAPQDATPAVPAANGGIDIYDGINIDSGAIAKSDILDLTFGMKSELSESNDLKTGEKCEENVKNEENVENKEENMDSNKKLDKMDEKDTEHESPKSVNSEKTELDDEEQDLNLESTLDQLEPPKKGNIKMTLTKHKKIIDEINKKNELKRIKEEAERRAQRIKEEAERRAKMIEAEYERRRKAREERHRNRRMSRSVSRTRWCRRRWGSRDRSRSKGRRRNRRRRDWSRSRSSSRQRRYSTDQSRSRSPRRRNNHSRSPRRRRRKSRSRSAEKRKVKSKSRSRSKSNERKKSRRRRRSRSRSNNRSRSRSKSRSRSISRKSRRKSRSKSKSRKRSRSKGRKSRSRSRSSSSSRRRSKSRNRRSNSRKRRSNSRSRKRSRSRSRRRSKRRRSSSSEARKSRLKSRGSRSREDNPKGPETKSPQQRSGSMDRNNRNSRSTSESSCNDSALTCNKSGHSDSVANIENIDLTPSMSAREEILKELSVQKSGLLSIIENYSKELQEAEKQESVKNITRDKAVLSPIVDKTDEIYTGITSLECIVDQSELSVSILPDDESISNNSDAIVLQDSQDNVKTMDICSQENILKDIDTETTKLSPEIVPDSRTLKLSVAGVWFDGCNVSQINNDKEEVKECTKSNSENTEKSSFVNTGCDTADPQSPQRLNYSNTHSVTHTESSDHNTCSTGHSGSNVDHKDMGKSHKSNTHENRFKKRNYRSQIIVSNESSSDVEDSPELNKTENKDSGGFVQRIKITEDHPVDRSQETSKENRLNTKCKDSIVENRTDVKSTDSTENVQPKKSKKNQIKTQETVKDVRSVEEYSLSEGELPRSESESDSDESLSSRSSYSSTSSSSVTSDSSYDSETSRSDITSSDSDCEPVREKYIPKSYRISLDQHDATADIINKGQPRSKSDTDIHDKNRNKLIPKKVVTADETKDSQNEKLKKYRKYGARSNGNVKPKVTSLRNDNEGRISSRTTLMNINEDVVSMETKIININQSEILDDKSQSETSRCSHGSKLSETNDDLQETGSITGETPINSEPVSSDERCDETDQESVFSEETLDERKDESDKDTVDEDNESNCSTPLSMIGIKRKDHSISPSICSDSTRSESQIVSGGSIRSGGSSLSVDSVSSQLDSDSTNMDLSSFMSVSDGESESDKKPDNKHMVSKKKCEEHEISSPPTDQNENNDHRVNLQPEMEIPLISSYDIDIIRDKTQMDKYLSYTCHEEFNSFEHSFNLPGLPNEHTQDNKQVLTDIGTNRNSPDRADNLMKLPKVIPQSVPELNDLENDFTKFETESPQSPEDTLPAKYTNVFDKFKTELGKFKSKLTMPVIEKTWMEAEVVERQMPLLTPDGASELFESTVSDLEAEPEMPQLLLSPTAEQVPCESVVNCDTVIKNSSKEQLLQESLSVKYELDPKSDLITRESEKDIASKATFKGFNVQTSEQKQDKMEKFTDEGNLRFDMPSLKPFNECQKVCEKCDPDFPLFDDVQNNINVPEKLAVFPQKSDMTSQKKPSENIIHKADIQNDPRVLEEEKIKTVQETNNELGAGKLSVNMMMRQVNINVKDNKSNEDLFVGTGKDKNKEVKQVENQPKNIKNNTEMTSSEFRKKPNVPESRIVTRLRSRERLKSTDENKQIGNCDTNLQIKKALKAELTVEIKRLKLDEVSTENISDTDDSEKRKLDDGENKDMNDTGPDKNEKKVANINENKVLDDNENKDLDDNEHKEIFSKKFYQSKEDKDEEILGVQEITETNNKITESNTETLLDIKTKQIEKWTLRPLTFSCTVHGKNNDISNIKKRIKADTETSCDNCETDTLKNDFFGLASGVAQRSRPVVEYSSDSSHSSTICNNPLPPGTDVLKSKTIKTTTCNSIPDVKPDYLNINQEKQNKNDSQEKSYKETDKPIQKEVKLRKTRRQSSDSSSSDSSSSSSDSSDSSSSSSASSDSSSDTDSSSQKVSLKGKKDIRPAENVRRRYRSPDVKIRDFLLWLQKENRKCTSRQIYLPEENTEKDHKLSDKGNDENRLDEKSEKKIGENKQTLKTSEAKEKPKKRDIGSSAISSSGSQSKVESGKLVKETSEEKLNKPKTSINRRARSRSKSKGRDRKKETSTTQDTRRSSRSTNREKRKSRSPEVRRSKRNRSRSNQRSVKRSRSKSSERKTRARSKSRDRTKEKTKELRSKNNGEKENRSRSREKKRRERISRDSRERSKSRSHRSRSRGHRSRSKECKKSSRQRSHSRSRKSERSHRRSREREREERKYKRYLEKFNAHNEKELETWDIDELIFVEECPHDDWEEQRECPQCLGTGERYNKRHLVVGKGTTSDVWWWGTVQLVTSGGGSSEARWRCWFKQILVVIGGSAHLCRSWL